MKIQVDYDLARAIGRDAGNANMREAGRTAWSREDYDAAVAMFDQVYPVEREEAEIAADADRVVGACAYCFGPVLRGEVHCCPEDPS